MRVEDPAATSTADTLFSNFFTCPIPKMCIRDRIHLLLQRSITTAGCKSRFLGRFFQGDSHGIHQLGPVSYTHLDVYKRQV